MQDSLGRFRHRPGLSLIPCPARGLQDARLVPDHRAAEGNQPPPHPRHHRHQGERDYPRPTREPPGQAGRSTQLNASRRHGAATSRTPRAQPIRWCQHPRSSSRSLYSRTVARASSTCSGGIQDSPAGPRPSGAPAGAGCRSCRFWRAASFPAARRCRPARPGAA